MKRFRDAILKPVLKRYNMRRSDLYEDDRVLLIVQGELGNYLNGKVHLGEVLDNLQYILTERAEVQEEQ